MKKPLLVLLLLAAVAGAVVPNQSREELLSPDERLRQNARTYMPRAVDPNSVWAKFLLWADAALGG